jgi:NhaA family Na+:H+ antiporter
MSLTHEKVIPAVTNDAPIVRIIRPFQDFVQNQAAGGMLLLFAAATALVWANSPWAASYQALWHTTFTIGFAGHELTRDLHFWVNDALMVIFFFLVGLEIKREVMVGELSTVRQSVLPVVAALGGVLFPAAIYWVMNAGTPEARGWGIPMATDIAFSLGVLALLGDRIPITLKVLLTALAIVDDIAAVVVIAVFYSTGIDAGALGMAAAILAASVGANRLGIRHPLPYLILGFALWLATLQSGVHATVAGVLMAATIPARTLLNPTQFLRQGRMVLEAFEESSAAKGHGDTEGQQAAVEALRDACFDVQPPLHRIEHILQPWVMFVIMPLFALANAGVILSGGLGEQIVSPVTLGVLFGLLIGKPLGVMVLSWLAVRSGFASLPPGVSRGHLHGVGWLAGIGFTMSLFVADLAFPDDSPELAMAKIGILAASMIAGVVGSLILLRATKRV